MDAILPSSGTSDVLASGLIRPPSGVCVLMSTYASETADNLRTSLETSATDAVLDGDLDDIMSAALAARIG